VEDVRARELDVGGETLHAATIVWGAGVEAVPLTRSLGIPVDKPGRIKVEPDCSIPGHPEAFALGDLAHWSREANPQLRVVAITGSNGKTTTKEMVAAICELATGGAADAVLKTAGNYNNLIGLPLTLLRMRGSESIAVLEMGMNQRGEIARMGESARPDFGVITNVGARGARQSRGCCRRQG